MERSTARRFPPLGGAPAGGAGAPCAAILRRRGLMERVQEVRWDARWRGVTRRVQCTGRAYVNDRQGSRSRPVSETLQIRASSRCDRVGSRRRLSHRTAGCRCEPTCVRDRNALPDAPEESGHSDRHPCRAHHDMPRSFSHTVPRRLAPVRSPAWRAPVERHQARPELRGIEQGVRAWRLPSRRSA